MFEKRPDNLFVRSFFIWGMLLLSSAMEIVNTVLNCTNCHEPITGDYCSSCGQKRFSPDNLSLSRFIRDFAKELFSFDNRLLRSLRPLLFQPGVLTRDYIDGKQKQFIRPVSLFVFVNLFFFFVGYKIGLMNWSILTSNGEQGRTMIEERANVKGLEVQEYVKELDKSYVNYQRSLFFAVIPLFALAMNVILIRKRRYFVEHLIYSIHYHSAYLIVLPLTSLLIVFVLGLFDLMFSTRLAPLFGNESGLDIYALLLMIGYHFIAVRTIYHCGYFLSLVLAFALSFASGVIMILLGQRLLFWLVWFTAS